MGIVAVLIVFGYASVAAFDSCSVAWRAATCAISCVP